METGANSVMGTANDVIVVAKDDSFLNSELLLLGVETIDLLSGGEDGRLGVVAAAATQIDFRSVFDQGPFHLLVLLDQALQHIADGLPLFLRSTQGNLQLGHTPDKFLLTPAGGGDLFT